MASTQNTGEGDGWLALLSTMTDDELDRYGEIARDQRGLEFDRAWAQIICVIGACLAALFCVREAWNGGVTRTSVLLLIATAALAYWPYQKARMRQMWKRHLAAVAIEKQRRLAANDEKVD